MLKNCLYARSLASHAAMLAFCRAYRGTGLGGSVSAGRSLDAENDTSPFYGSRVGVNCSSVGPLRLAALKWLGNSLFYFNPARIYRIFRDLPNHTPRVLLMLLGKMTSRTLFLK